MADTSEQQGEGGLERLEERDISEEMKSSYMQYAMSVIKSRALPDIRDGLKPSQRRVIYAMHELNLGPRSKRVKSAKVVGDTMGNYHPHGDQAIYMTLVRMAQPFAARYVFVDPKGNWGSIGDPSPAAYRYTECRMAQAAADMVADIDQETVDMIPNYDNTRTEPSVLPSKFPNLICNGSQGIAVGMATSIPPHNLNEVCDALTVLVQDPGITDKDLLRHIPAPDFPTGGVICGRSGIRKAYATGRGAITVRGKVDISVKGEKATIKITELPYQVTTEALKEKIQEAFKAQRIQGITALKDQSGGEKDVELVIECKRGEDPHVVLNQLYKHTPLQNTFSVIMIALEQHREGVRPRTFALRELLQAFIDHRFVVIRRRTEYLLRRTRDRIEILEGLEKALDAIDEVIKIVRSSADADEARKRLMDTIEVNRRQADAILDMRLQRLTGLERTKLLDELRERRAQAADYADILARRERVVGVFVDEMNELKGRYGDARRTRIEEDEAVEIDDEDLISVEDCVVTVTHQGYIKRTALDAYRVQRRAGTGLYGAAKSEEDFVERIFQASTKDYVLCFTSEGRAHWLKVHQVPEGSRTARGRGIRNLIALLPKETVTSFIPVQGEFDDDHYLVMATAKGVIKKVQLSSFARPRKAGVVAVKLDEGDRLVGVRITDGSNQLVLATRCGKAIRFQEETVRPMGRSARGVKGIALEDEDEVVSLVVVGEEGPYLLTACELGYGKRTEVEEYRETNRGGKGIINIKITAKNGYVVGVQAVKPGDQAMMITSSGKLIRISADDVSAIGRNTQGVRVIRVDAGEKVVAVARVVVDENEEGATPAVTPVASSVPEDVGDDADLEEEEDGASAADEDGEE